MTIDNDNYNLMNAKNLKKLNDCVKEILNIIEEELQKLKKIKR